MLLHRESLLSKSAFLHVKYQVCDISLKLKCKAVLKGLNVIVIIPSLYCYKNSNTIC